MYGTDQISLQCLWTVIITITTAVSPFSQIQLLSVSAGSSVLETGEQPVTQARFAVHNRHPTIGRGATNQLKVGQRFARPITRTMPAPGYCGSFGTPILCAPVSSCRAMLCRSSSMPSAPAHESPWPLLSCRTPRFRSLQLLHLNDLHTPTTNFF